MQDPLTENDLSPVHLGPHGCSDRSKSIRRYSTSKRTNCRLWNVYANRRQRRTVVLSLSVLVGRGRRPRGPCVDTTVSGRVGTSRDTNLPSILPTLQCKEERGMVGGTVGYRSRVPSSLGPVSRTTDLTRGPLVGLKFRVGRPTLL